MNGFFHIPSDKPMSDNELRAFFGHNPVGVAGPEVMCSTTDKIIIDRIAQIAIDLNLSHEPRSSFGVIDCPFITDGTSMPPYIIHGFKPMILNLDYQMPTIKGPIGMGKNWTTAIEVMRRLLYVPTRKHKPRNHIYARYFQRKGKIRL